MKKAMHPNYDIICEDTKVHAKLNAKFMYSIHHRLPVEHIHAANLRFRIQHAKRLPLKLNIYNIIFGISGMFTIN